MIIGVARVDQRQQQASEIVDMDDRTGAPGWERDKAHARAAEHFEIIDIARAIDAGWADDRPVEAAVFDQALRFRLGRTIDR